MILKGYTAVIDDLVRIYPKVMIMEQLAQLYREQLKVILKELNQSMNDCRTQVTPEVYDREQAELRLLAAWVSTDPKDVYILERSLKYLLKRQRAFADLLLGTKGTHA